MNVFCSDIGLLAAAEDQCQSTEAEEGGGGGLGNGCNLKILKITSRRLIGLETNKEAGISCCFSDRDGIIDDDTTA